MFLKFFDDEERPFGQQGYPPESITAAIVGGVDMGLAQALADYSNRAIQEHKALAREALTAGDKQAFQYHLDCIEEWEDVRGEAHAVYFDIVRTRSN